MGAFSIESNSFVPSETVQSDFERQVWFLGDSVTRDCAGPVSELAGAWDALVDAGMQPVGTVAAVASPGAPVSRNVFEAITSEILERCTADVAGVYLMLHGSALVSGEDDPEGLLLRTLRKALGPDIPIAISLDLHAYITNEMMENTSIVTAYRTCPHIDLYRTGHQAGELLAEAVQGKIRPICRRVWLPMITPPERHNSAEELFAGLQQLCDEAESQGALAAALLCTQPWLDVPELGWSVVVTWDDDSDAATRTANQIAELAWNARHAFMETSQVPLQDAIEAAVAAEGPFVIADLGDATNGGSLGDSTELLRALLHRYQEQGSAGSAALTLVDPDAVNKATQAGEGSTVELKLGSGRPESFNEVTVVRGEVQKLWDGEIVYSHPAAEGVVDSPGKSALVAVGDILVIVHSRPVRVIDPAIYFAAGIDISNLKMVQAKSHVSYRAGFDHHTSGSVLADTRGPTAANLSYLPFSRRPQPLFPFENCEWLAQ